MAGFLTTSLLKTFLINLSRFFFFNLIWISNSIIFFCSFKFLVNHRANHDQIQIKILLLFAVCRFFLRASLLISWGKSVKTERPSREERFLWNWTLLEVSNFTKSSPNIVYSFELKKCLNRCIMWFCNLNDEEDFLYIGFITNLNLHLQD